MEIHKASASSASSSSSSAFSSSNSFANFYPNSSDNECARDREIIYALELTHIREIIETMTKFNQIEVLKILCKTKDITINENKYGIHVNLSELSKETIDELKTYINYVNTQEIQLHHIEKQKETFINTYFAKDNKDNTIKYV